jgi:putative membrane protein insertion efficiency factor
VRRKYLTYLILGAVALLQAWDLSRSPDKQVSARVLLGGIGLYRGYVSDLVGAAGVVCRFEPSCSRYAELSIRKHGAGGGMWRSMTRIVRCGPWTPAGTVDPP